MDSLVTFTRPLGNAKTHVPQTCPENKKEGSVPGS